MSLQPFQPPQVPQPAQAFQTPQAPKATKDARPWQHPQCGRIALVIVNSSAPFPGTVTEYVLKWVFDTGNLPGVFTMPGYTPGLPSVSYLWPANGGWSDPIALGDEFIVTLPTGATETITGVLFDDGGDVAMLNGPECPFELG